MQLLQRIVFCSLVLFSIRGMASTEPVAGAPSLDSETTEYDNAVAVTQKDNNILSNSPQDNHEVVVPITAENKENSTVPPPSESVTKVEDENILSSKSEGTTEIPDKQVEHQQKPEQVVSTSSENHDSAGAQSVVTSEESPQLPAHMQQQVGEGQQESATVISEPPLATASESLDNVEASPVSNEHSVISSTKETITDTTISSPVPVKPAPNVLKPAQNPVHAPATIVLLDKNRQDFYTIDYLENMYLPYFYNTYELPQPLSANLVLRDVNVDTQDATLVYAIGVADTIGPMDFDGHALDNKILNLFCKIALNDAILHRLPYIHLEFYHDDHRFYTKELGMEDCIVRHAPLIAKKLTNREAVRLDNEFIFAYEAQDEQMLSAIYLRTQFVPYALDRIGEKFLPIEQKPVMSLDEQQNIVITITVEQASEILNPTYLTDRIARTCNIGTYSKYVLPRVKALKYRYITKQQQVIKELTITHDNCEELKKQITPTENAK